MASDLACVLILSAIAAVLALMANDAFLKWRADKVRGSRRREPRRD